MSKNQNDKQQTPNHQNQQNQQNQQNRQKQQFENRNDKDCR